MQDFWVRYSEWRLQYDDLDRRIDSWDIDLHVSRVMWIACGSALNDLNYNVSRYSFCSFLLSYIKILRTMLGQSHSSVSNM